MHATLIQDNSHLIESLTDIKDKLTAATEQQHTASQSAQNFCHYLALKQQITSSPLDKLLHDAGLSLDAISTHVMFALEQNIRVLSTNTDNTLATLSQKQHGKVTPSQATEILNNNRQYFFNSRSAERKTAIMATLPNETAWNEELVADLLTQGMNAARIDCNVDDHGIWRNMISNINVARKRTGKPCAIFMDIPSYQHRTIIKPTTQESIKIKPEYDNQTALPTPIIFHTKDCYESNLQLDIDYQIKISHDALTSFQDGDRLFFIDGNQKKRFISLRKIVDNQVWVGHCWKKTTLSKTIEIELQRQNADEEYETIKTFSIDAIQNQPTAYQLRKKDRLVLNNNVEHNKEENAYVCISCSTPDITKKLTIGQTVWFDNGKIGGYVESIESYGTIIQITHAKKNGSKLRHNRTINFPGLELDLPFNHYVDTKQFDFICQHADIIGISIENQQQLLQLCDELKKRDIQNKKLIIKISHKSTVSHLPEIILTSLSHHPFCVMLDHEELLIELGAIQYAQLQHDIINQCRAAHTPIMSTEKMVAHLSRKGTTSRQELYDAIRETKDCVLLEKGPYLATAVETLDYALKITNQ